MQNQAHIDSWYAASANLQLDFQPLQGEASADVCIIGAGYTGLSTAIHLRKHGYSVILLETNKMAWGGTLAITMNRMPDFGRLSSRVFYAHGYSGHGVPIATLAAKLPAEVIGGSAWADTHPPCGSLLECRLSDILLTGHEEPSRDSPQPDTIDAR